MRRFTLWIPVMLVFVLTSVVFLAARAPRTWAAHWSTPRLVARGSGQNEYGAVYGRYGWDVLWYDDDRQALVLTQQIGRGRKRSSTLDRGDITQPTLLDVDNHEVAAWVHNHNGSTDLMAANIAPHRVTRIFRLVGSAWPVEHPYLFAGPGGAADLVFSWQRYGSFDVFLLSLRPGHTRPSFVQRLTHSQIYAFYPRAVLDRAGSVAVLYLDACCQARIWHVMLDRYDTDGRLLGQGESLAALGGPGASNSTPTQWAGDIGIDSAGHIVGAYSGDAGVWVFRAAGAEVARISQRLLDPLAGTPASLALVAGPGIDYLLWEQPFDLGTCLTSQRFDATLGHAAPPERVVYESSAQTGVHAVRQGASVLALWQAITPGRHSTFETTTTTDTRQPDLAQRFGLGLGNPFEALAVLIVVATGVAVITTTGNILTIMGYGLAGMLMMRLLSRIPGRWTLFGVVLSATLVLTFVKPGGPILFLGTLPAMGFPAVPFGVLAGAAVLLLMLWLGDVVLGRVEDVFRIALLIAVGVYFFAFLEAIVFVQQRLGYI